MEYRSDIDGLRAVSIISVLLFHFKVPGFSGGYVGVDIFFIISGFLIGTIIITECRRGEFSLLNFYERRIRRIFPALFAVLVVSVAYCALYFLPDQFSFFGSSLLYASLFLSNLFFNIEGTNYFVEHIDVKPLLHTWSLSIEEQFYLFFPIFVLSLFLIPGERLRERWLFNSVLGISVLSLCISVYLSRSMPVTAFFATPSRAWELMGGVLLATGRIPVPGSVFFRQALAVLGVILISGSVFLFTRETPFPGLYALAPCLGGVALILAGSGGRHIASGILESAPFVFVGKISYSLYLWHWPLYIFFTHHSMRSPTASESLLLAVVSFVISCFSWRFIEQPFRKRQFAREQSHAYFFGGTAVITGVVAGVVIVATSGLPIRIDPEIRQIAMRSNHVHAFRHCHSRRLEDLRNGDVCKIGDQAQSPTFVIWGDSHADMHVPALDKAARMAGTSGLVMTMSGCPPVTKVRKTWLSEDEGNCEAYNEEVVRTVMRSDSIRKVLMAGFWKRQAAGFKGRYFVDDDSTEVSAEETKRVFKRSLTRQIQSLKGKKVYIIADVPYVGHELPMVIARSKMLTGEFPKINLSVTRDSYIADQHRAFEVFREISEEQPVEIVRLDDVLCPDGVCDFIRDGKFLYRDEDHLSNIGAMLLVDKYRALLQH